VDFFSSVKRNMTTAAYAQITGRASRSEYWWFLLIFTVIGILLLLYWLVKASDASANKYGEGPARA